MHAMLRRQSLAQRLIGMNLALSGPPLQNVHRGVQRAHVVRISIPHASPLHINLALRYALDAERRPRWRIARCHGFPNGRFVSPRVAAGGSLRYDSMSGYGG